MKVSIQSEGFVGSAVLDNHVRRLVNEYLAPHDINIETVAVTLHDQRDARGVRQRLAHLQLALRDLPEIESEAQSDDLYVAIRRCVQRAHRHLERSQRRSETTSALFRAATG